MKLLSMAEQANKIIFSVIMAGLIVLGETQSQKSIEQDILARILGKDYDGRVLPSNSHNVSDAVHVKVNMYIRSIDLTNSNNMECGLHLTFRQSWVDPRLEYQRFVSPNLNYITLTDVNQIWVPDIFFPNEKEAHLHDLMVNNNFIRIFPDGEVLMSSRISLLLDCPMDFGRFPFDEQIVTFKMASYGYTDEDIVFEWKSEDPVQISSNLNLFLFNWNAIATSDCDSKTNTGSYSCLRADISLKRHCCYYLTQIYIPCAMVVIVSWFQFWLHPENIVARTVIGISSLYVLATQVSEMNLNFPIVSYTKSIDWYTGISLTFVFAALIESIFVNYYMSREKSVHGDPKHSTKNDAKVDMETLSNHSSPDGPNVEDPVRNNEGNSRGTGTLKRMTKNYMRRFGAKSEKIDGASRIIYPTCFVLFIILYLIFS